MSLVASFISGIALLGTGTEIYLYGTQYCYMLISIFASGTFLHFIIIPVLHDIKVTSVYEVGVEVLICSYLTIFNWHSISRRDLTSGFVSSDQLCTAVTQL